VSNMERDPYPGDDRIFPEEVQQDGVVGGTAKSGNPGVCSMRVSLEPVQEWFLNFLRISLRRSRRTLCEEAISP